MNRRNDMNNIIYCIFMVFFGLLCTKLPIIMEMLLNTSTTNTEVSKFSEQLIYISGYIKYFGIGCTILGMLIMTLMVIRIAGAGNILAFDDKTNTLIFRILDGKKSKKISVSVDKLSSDTKLMLRKKIETPLQKLYEVAYNGKRAKEEYGLCKDYITFIAQDLDNAIKQCENELMEQKIIERLPIIESAINNITDKVADGVLTDKDEKRFLKELQAESYEPFSLTDNMNKLHIK